MSQKMSVSEISKILFDADPMGTCCKENDCFDEYDAIARAIFQQLSSGRPADEAVSETLMDWFEVESIEPTSLASIVLALKTESRS
ncbi:hypothetical protein [Pseudomonas sp. N040]|uniref:hypothetical protein n=1 Tax=Pseudomonas sp. N040 TaxID=2785325 RepID=UPI0018A256D2|nr:hypothetical protein [Pseudomonas sp. N040]MBF7731117.1 hypothetical protein [Pseudomonas sp. N040]MBW7014760.1 hypothetical protein [Pseudomonas sp. N040]